MTDDVDVARLWAELVRAQRVVERQRAALHYVAGTLLGLLDELVDVDESLAVHVASIGPAVARLAARAEQVPSPSREPKADVDEPGLSTSLAAAVDESQRVGTVQAEMRGLVVGAEPWSRRRAAS